MPLKHLTFIQLSVKALSPTNENMIPHYRKIQLSQFYLCVNWGLLQQKQTYEIIWLYAWAIAQDGRALGMNWCCEAASDF